MRHGLTTAPQNWNMQARNGNIQTPHEPGSLRLCRSLTMRWPLCLWWERCFFLVDFLACGATNNASTYGATFQCLRTACRHCHLGLLTEACVLLLHDNTCLHTATSIQELLQHFCWENLNQPSYSPDLVLSDFHLYPVLKEHLDGRRFQKRRGC